MSSDWTILREHHCDGRNVSVLAAASDTDLAACKAHCLSRGYTGFTTWRGKAFFREVASASVLRAASKKCAGCEVYLAPAAAATSSSSVAPTPAAAPPPPSKPKAKAKAREAKASTAKGATTPPPVSSSTTSTRTSGSSGATQQLQRLRREEEEAAQLRAQLEALEAMSLGGGGGGCAPLYCSHCNKPITGEHLLIDTPGTDEESPVHEACYEAALPTCAWCRVQLADSYVLFRGARYGIVTLHEACRAAFERANANTASAGEILSLDRPSQARAAGRDSDRIFIDALSPAECIRELRRRGVRPPAKVTQKDLTLLCRRHWDDPVQDAP